MADAKTVGEKHAPPAGALRVTVVTPRGPVADEETDGVTAPGELGEFEVLPGHVPFLTKLHPGVLILGDKQAQQVFAVSSGFLEVQADGEVNVLVEKALPAGKVDAAAAKAVVDELGPKLKDWQEDTGAEWKNLKARVEWAQAQLDAQDKG